MRVDIEFLKAVQRAGWHIVTADETRCVATCPEAGCGARVMLRPGQRIPQRAIKPPNDHKFTGFDDARRFLRDRRESLCLTIRELEETAGMSVDFLAKFERDDWDKTGTIRQPNVSTFAEWAQALGYELVLRPTSLPPIVLRAVADTRKRTHARISRHRTERERRESD